MSRVATTVHQASDARPSLLASLEPFAFGVVGVVVGNSLGPARGWLYKISTRAWVRGLIIIALLLAGVAVAYYVQPDPGYGIGGLAVMLAINTRLGTASPPTGGREPVGAGARR